MKIFLFLVSLLGFLIAKSQTLVYHPFPDSNTIWNFEFVKAQCQFGWASEDYSIKISGDTVIGSQTYHKLIIPYVHFDDLGSCTQTNTIGYKGAIREDEANKKVFFVNPMSLSETLLYDFNMQVGDTVQGYLEEWYGNKDVVVSIDSILVGNSYRKRWEINPSYGIYLIEGLGSTFGLIEFSPGNGSDFDSYRLNCFQQNSQTRYPDTNTNCQLITSKKLIEPLLNQVKIFPNPTSGSFIVDFVGTFGITEIQIADLLGTIVYQNQITNQLKVNIAKLPSGVYTLIVKYRGNRTFSKKIISCP